MRPMNFDAMKPCRFAPDRRCNEIVARLLHFSKRHRPRAEFLMIRRTDWLLPLDQLMRRAHACMMQLHH